MRAIQKVVIAKKKLIQNEEIKFLSVYVPLACSIAAKKRNAKVAGVH